MSQIAAYVEEFRQSLREWHHGFSGGDLERVKESVFGADEYIASFMKQI